MVAPIYSSLVTPKSSYRSVSSLTLGIGRLFQFCPTGERVTVSHHGCNLYFPSHLFYRSIFVYVCSHAWYINTLVFISNSWEKKLILGVLKIFYSQGWVIKIIERPLKYWMPGRGLVCRLAAGGGGLGMRFPSGTCCQWGSSAQRVLSRQGTYQHLQALLPGIPRAPADTLQFRIGRCPAFRSF